MGRKKQSNPFADVDGLDGCAYAVISDKQYNSAAYKMLSEKGKDILTVCKLCRQFHVGTDKNGNSRTINGNRLYFYLNRELAERYGFKNPNVTRLAMIEVVKYGFIDVIENNSHRHKKNVYAYSSKWLEYCGNDLELSRGARTFIQGKKKN